MIRKDVPDALLPLTRPLFHSLGSRLPQPCSHPPAMLTLSANYLACTEALNMPLERSHRRIHQKINASIAITNESTPATKAADAMIFTGIRI